MNLNLSPSDVKLLCEHLDEYESEYLIINTDSTESQINRIRKKFELTKLSLKRNQPLSKSQLDLLRECAYYALYEPFKEDTSYFLNLEDKDLLRLSTEDKERIVLIDRHRILFNKIVKKKERRKLLKSFFEVIFRMTSNSLNEVHFSKSISPDNIYELGFPLDEWITRSKQCHPFRFG